MGDATTNEKVTFSEGFGSALEHGNNISRDYVSLQSKSSYLIDIADLKSFYDDFHKKYADDETVKEFASLNGVEGTGDSNGNLSLTNSFLDRLEQQVLQNGLQPPAEDNSTCRLDAHTRFFKTTVEEIFETFYSTMRDIETFKLRYKDILARNTTNNVDEMENFIKDIIQHIVLSDASNDSIRTGDTYDVCNSVDECLIYNDKPVVDIEKIVIDSENKDKSVELVIDNEKPVVDFVKPVINKRPDGSSRETLLEAYKNQNFYVKTEDGSSNNRQSSRSDDIYSIYLISNAPSVEIRGTDRNMQSEINIKRQKEIIDTKVVSADNLQKVAAKRRELEEPEHQQDESFPDRDIPIRFCSAKKNLSLNEDFHNERIKNDKSFISKICSYLCKRIRKNI